MINNGLTPRRLFAFLAPRILISIVTFWNILCAIEFIINPEGYLAAFDLGGNSGIAVIRSVGILFLMWSVPYILAIIHPYRWRILVITAIVMQSIGCIGEIWIRSQIHAASMMSSSIQRFIVFDLAGLFLLILSFLLVLNSRRSYYV